MDSSSASRRKLIVVGETRVSDIAASFEKRRPMSTRISGEQPTAATGTKCESPVGGRTPSARLSGDQLFFATNGADSPKPEFRRTLKPYRSSGMDSSSTEVNNSSPGSDSPKPDLPRRPLRSYKSGELLDSPRTESNRRLISRPSAEEFSSGPRGSGGFNQRFPGVPSPRDRVGSQRGAAMLLSEPQPREVVRVVSQRALTTQVAKSYLQTIEHQKLQSDRAFLKKKEEEEEEARWQSKKKTARRLLGSFSMYQVPGFSEIELSEIDSESALSSPASSSPRSPSSLPQANDVANSKALSLALNDDQLDEEYELEVLAVLHRRALLRTMMMWYKVASHRAEFRQRKAKMYKLPNIAFARRKSRRIPAMSPSTPNKFAPRRTSRMSVVRRPTSEDPTLETVPSEWFDLSAGLNRKHQLNMGRRSIKPRLSVTGTPPKQFRLRKSTIGQGNLAPPTIKENERLRLDEEGFADIPENTALSPPQMLKIVVAPPSGVLSGGKGLQRTVSWSQKGMGVIKSMFSPPAKLLSRIPSKEKILERTPSKEKMTTVE